MTEHGNGVPSSCWAFRFRGMNWGVVAKLFKVYHFTTEALLRKSHVQNNQSNVDINKTCPLLLNVIFLLYLSFCRDSLVGEWVSAFQHRYHMPNSNSRREGKWSMTLVLLETTSGWVRNVWINSSAISKTGDKDVQTALQKAGLEGSGKFSESNGAWVEP